MTSFADQVVDVTADALLAADEASTMTVAECPSCGDILTVGITKKYTDHPTPVCPEWVQYMENWHPPKVTP